MNIKKIIKEEVALILKAKQKLMEINDSNHKPFQYTSRHDDRKYIYMIKITDDIIIQFEIIKYVKRFNSYIPPEQLQIEKGKTIYLLTFDLTYESNEKLIQKEPKRQSEVDQTGFLSYEQTLRLLNTFVQILNDFIKNLKHDNVVFIFTPYKKQLIPIDKNNAYIYFIKNNIPYGWKYKVFNNQTVYIYK